MPEKEPAGAKTRVKIQVFKVEPIINWVNVPNKFRKRSDGLRKMPMHRIWAETSDICDRQRLAYTIRRNYGYSCSAPGEKGFFIVMFYNRFVKNKKFNKKFICSGEHCQYYKTKCRIWGRHQRGWACRKNRRVICNWSPRSGLAIYPFDAENYGIDYKYKFMLRYHKMYYFKKWFWKDK